MTKEEAIIWLLTIGVGVLINVILSKLDALNTKMDEILKDIRKRGG